MFERTISVILLSKLASHGRLHLTYTYDLETYPNTGFPRISASAIIEDKTNIPPVAFPVHCFQVELQFIILVFVLRTRAKSLGVRTTENQQTETTSNMGQVQEFNSHHCPIPALLIQQLG